MYRDRAGASTKGRSVEAFLQKWCGPRKARRYSSTAVQHWLRKGERPSGGMLHRQGQKKRFACVARIISQRKGRDPRRPSSTGHRPHIDQPTPFPPEFHRVETRRRSAPINIATRLDWRLAGQMANGNGGPMGGLARAIKKGPSLPQPPAPSPAA